jgi:hypothetical protein
VAGRLAVATGGSGVIEFPAELVGDSRHLWFPNRGQEFEDHEVVLEPGRGVVVAGEII